MIDYFRLSVMTAILVFTISIFGIAIVEKINVLIDIQSDIRDASEVYMCLSGLDDMCELANITH